MRKVRFSCSLSIQFHTYDDTPPPPEVYYALNKYIFPPTNLIPFARIIADKSTIPAFIYSSYCIAKNKKI